MASTSAIEDFDLITCTSTRAEFVLIFVARPVNILLVWSLKIEAIAPWFEPLLNDPSVFILIQSLGGGL
ncbi:hypothetical protein PIB30_093522 [Stylosanthes scabra]|uniref:Uncharacterized protein n=1 Tax=Stylosanthes scabra TaxID=79078 RepID=A0ABU6ZTT0_9FABA|nr:hypothetical protein [Stylosanthes scabra]